jgi:hypothetical protein
MFFMTTKLGWNAEQPKETPMIIEPLVFTITCKPSPTGDGWILGISDKSLTTLHHVPTIDDACHGGKVDVNVSAIDVDSLCAGLADMGRYIRSATDEQPTENHNMDTPANKSARETIDHITGGRVHPEIRTKLRDALDKADAAPVGREKSDSAVGRAIRLGGV